MTDLIRLEHKKLWGRRSTKISVFLCFFYVIVIVNILCFQWFSYGSSGDHTSAFGNHFDGYTMIRDSKEYSRTFGGELTDETLQRMVKEYQDMAAADLDRERQLTDRPKIDSWLEQLYPELRDTGTYYTMITYADPEKLTGFYERRTQALEDFLEISEQTGAERAYLLQMEEKVEKPFSYEFLEGWSNILTSMAAELGTVMALFLAVVLSPLFSGEWRDNTSPLLLTTRYGWEKIARAKIITGLLFTTELFLLLAAGGLITQSFYLGWSGWDMPIQMIKLIAVAPMNMLQAEIYEYGFTLLGALGYTGIILLISAAVKNNMFALIFSLAAVYLPPVISRYLPYGLQKALDLLPLVGSPTDIFRTNTFCLFGKYIWSPCLLITAPILIGLLCAPFAVKKWSRRMKK